jgi:hypothetical protein
MSEMASRLYEPLAAHAPHIAGSADRQSVPYVASTWRSWLDRADVRPDVAHRVFDAIGSQTVSRPQIRVLAKDADSADGRLALLIAVRVGKGKKERQDARRHCAHADPPEPRPGT